MSRNTSHEGNFGNDSDAPNLRDGLKNREEIETMNAISKRDAHLTIPKTDIRLELSFEKITAETHYSLTSPIARGTRLANLAAERDAALEAWSKKAIFDPETEDDSDLLHSYEIESELYRTPVTTLGDVAILLRELFEAMHVNEWNNDENVDHSESLYIRRLKQIIDAVEASKADPVFAVIAEYWAAAEAYDKTENTPHDKTAEQRWSRAYDAFRNTRPATVEGMAAKAEALKKFFVEGGHAIEENVLDELAGYLRSLGNEEIDVRTASSVNDPAVDAVQALRCAERQSYSIDEDTDPERHEKADRKVGDAYHAMLDTPAQSLDGALAKLEWLADDLKTDYDQDTAANRIIKDIMPHLRVVAPGMKFSRALSVTKPERRTLHQGARSDMTE